MTAKQKFPQQRSQIKDDLLDLYATTAAWVRERAFVYRVRGVPAQWMPITRQGEKGGTYRLMRFGLTGPDQWVNESNIERRAVKPQFGIGSAHAG